MFSNATYFVVLLFALFCQSTHGFNSFREAFSCPTPNGIFPKPGEQCSKNYYSCVNGTATEMTCPSGTAFDPETLKCSSSFSATCSTTTAGTTYQAYSTSTSTAKTSTTTAGTTYQASSTSTSTTKPSTTTAGTTYVPDSTSSSTTKTSTTTTPTTSTPTTTTPTVTPGNTTIECGANGNYPNPNDCHTFYMCSNGTPYLYDCPSELVFNPKTKSCDYVANVPGC